MTSTYPSATSKRSWPPFAGEKGEVSAGSRPGLSIGAAGAEPAAIRAASSIQALPGYDAPDRGLWPSWQAGAPRPWPSSGSIEDNSAAPRHQADADHEVAGNDSRRGGAASAVPDVSRPRHQCPAHGGVE